ncbi:molybdopterin-binding protein [Halobacteria archaeon AArc-dxtr1]|nr:molybdopterin-binding protein [Halobacteria archaeon AArc-dxtr1]
MDAAVVTVGDELLAGRTANTNATWLCERLTDHGTRVGRVTTVPDRVADIARVVNEYRAAYDAVVVTGGLGPTHDDVTMAGVAAALGCDLAESEAVISRLTETGGYERGDLADGTAEIPEGARPLHNDVGVAPGAVLEGVYVFPGVPAEMRAMFDSVADEFTGRTRHQRTVVVDEPESALVDRIETVRDRFDVSVGSYPGESVRILVEGYRSEMVEDAVAWLKSQVDLAEE